jgi:hypothetical protein
MGRRQFLRSLRTLCWYVYLPAAMALESYFYKLLGSPPNNFGFIPGFQFNKAAAHAPIWLVSAGPLIYSAATAAGFSLHYLKISVPNHRNAY